MNDNGIGFPWWFFALIVLLYSFVFCLLWFAG